MTVCGGRRRKRKVREAFGLVTWVKTHVSHNPLTHLTHFALLLEPQNMTDTTQEKPNEKPPVVVLGGGAAGMLAALGARQAGAPVLLIEKKNRLGTKILISGGGKCNLTHDGSMEDIRVKFRQNEGRFLRPSFYKFTNEDFLNLLHQKGMETYVRPDGRIFPVAPSDAKDVVAQSATAKHPFAANA